MVDGTSNSSNQSDSHRKTFDVFELPEGGYHAIKHGFSWPAFFFHCFWCMFFASLYGWGALIIGILMLGKVQGF